MKFPWYFGIFTIVPVCSSVLTHTSWLNVFFFRSDQWRLWPKSMNFRRRKVPLATPRNGEERTGSRWIDITQLLGSSTTTCIPQIWGLLWKHDDNPRIHWFWGIPLSDKTSWLWDREGLEFLWPRKTLCPLFPQQFYLLKAWTARDIFFTARAWRNLWCVPGHCMTSWIHFDYAALLHTAQIETTWSHPNLNSGNLFYKFLPYTTGC